MADLRTGCGLFPYGFGWAGMSSVFPIPVEVDTHGTAGAAFIGANGDYECDGLGDVIKTMHIKQRVALLLRTEFGSVTGQRLLGLASQRAVDASWDYRMRRAVDKALKPAIDDGSINLDRVVLEQTTSIRARITVLYTILETGEEVEEEVF